MTRSNVPKLPKLVDQNRSSFDSRTGHDSISKRSSSRKPSQTLSMIAINLKRQLDARRSQASIFHNGNQQRFRQKQKLKDSDSESHEESLPVIVIHPVDDDHQGSSQSSDVMITPTPRGSLASTVQRRIFVNQMSNSDPSDSLSGSTTRERFLARWRNSERQSQRREIARRRIRRVFSLALLVIQWLKYVYYRASENIVALMSVSQLDDEPGRFGGTELLFDPHLYKAKREGQLPMEARRILQKPSYERTNDELLYLRIALRNMQEFVEYPVNIQREICRIGWYETYGPKRAIIREGHVPFCFYIILSGSVVVTVMEEETNTSRTVCFLHKGMSFGEMALITHSRRQATIVSKTCVEFLCISGEDYEDMFMAGGSKIWDDPVTMRLLREVNCLVEWPTYVLNEYPNDCLFQFFTRGSILARDSVLSGWIYIVRSGSLSVFKKFSLKSDQRGSQLKPESSDLTRSIDAIRKANELHCRKRWKHGPLLPINMDFTLLAEEGAPRAAMKAQAIAEADEEIFGSRAEMEISLEKRIPGFIARDDRLGLIDYEEIFTEHLHQLKPPKESSSLLTRRRWRKHGRGAYLVANFAARLSISSNPVSELLPEGNRRRIITRTFDHAANLVNDNENETTRNEALFVQVQILERGQYFGVSNIIFSEQPSLILVSNGAECIMISKKLYIKLASEACMRHLRKTEVPMPSEEELMENLKAFKGWQGVKEKLVNQTVDMVRTKKKMAVYPN